MSNIYEKIKKLEIKCEKSSEISRASHFQNKGEFTELKTRILKIEEKIANSYNENPDIEEIKESISNLNRGLKNLWSELKKSKDL